MRKVITIMTSPAHPELLDRAIRQFLRQGYAARELVVLDPSAESRSSLIPDDERILYVRVEPWRTLASQRQLSMGLASGELIMHWRGEDWYAPHWIEAQVDALFGAEADLSLAHPSVPTSPGDPRAHAGADRVV